MKPIIACGTSEGKNLYEGKFDSSPYFHIYEIDVRGIEFLDEIKNISPDNTEDREIEDETRAQNVSSLLKAKSVNVLLAHQLEPKIAKISKNFVPIISHELDIQAALSSIKDKLHLVEREWRKGKSRDYLIIGES